MLNVTVSSIIWSMSEYVLWQFGSWKYVHIILLILFGLAFFWGCFPGSSDGKESACNAGDLSLIPGLGRSPGEGKGYSLQYSGLENSIDYTVHGVAKSRTQLSDFHVLFFDKISIAWASLTAQLVKNPAAMQKTLVQFLGGEDSLEKG